MGLPSFVFDVVKGAVAGLAAAFLVTAGPVAAQDAMPSDPAEPAPLIKAGEGPAARVLVSPQREARLAADLGGRIAAIPVDNGDRFAKGDTLVSFACDLHEAALAEARAALDAARHAAANQRDLAQMGSTGALDVALAEAEARGAAARVAQQQGMVRRCTITAPYDGRVVERLAQPHESVAVGTPLLAVLDDTALELDIVVPSGWLAWLEEGAPFTVTLDETGTTHAGRVTGIGARIDAVSQSVPITGRLLDRPDRLLAGMSGTAVFDPTAAPVEPR